jgi:hypothetical protein
MPLATPSRGATTEPDNAPVYQYGGFVSDNTGERFEHEGLHEGDNRSTESLKYKVRMNLLCDQCLTPFSIQSITQIKEIYSAPTPSRVTQSNKQKRRYVSFEDLPPGTKACFKKRVIPLSLDRTGTGLPWETPGDEAIINIWNTAFDGTDHLLEEGDFKCDMFNVVRILVSPRSVALH